jgi:P22 coat protein - gene protein 5
MSYPTNTLVAVQTYQKSGLAFLQNQFCGIATANSKFKNFQDMIANLGDTVQFDLMPRFVSSSGLVVTWQPAAQRVQSLTCGQSRNVGYSVTNQQFIFNVEDYVDTFNKAAVIELGSYVEQDIWGVVETNSYRTYGDFTIAGGVSTMNAINSYQQLAQAIAQYKDFGCPDNADLKFYIPLVAQSAIVGSGLSQFVPKRNDEIAMSWDVGNFSDADFYTSNLLNIHTAGTIGNTGADITVVSIDSTGTLLSVTTTAAGTFKAGDIIRFKASVSPVRFLTFTGHAPCSVIATARVTADATANGSGAVTLSIFPALISDTTLATANIDTAIAAGQVLQCFPNHRMALLIGGNARYLAMPRLPDQSPFVTANSSDPESGLSVRMTYGATFGGNQMGMIVDTIWGTTMVDEYAMRVAFPVAS